MPTLIVDSRETNSGIPALLRSAGVPFEQQELAAGDYRLGNMLFERKSCRTDFAESVMAGRLFGQAEAVCAECERPIFLLEGNLRDVRSQITEDAMWGAISALSVFWHMQVMFTPDAQGTAKLLETMWRHTTHGLGYEVPLRVRKPKPAPDGAISSYLVEGLPGVGPETARRLVTHFGSARAVFMATPQQMRECKGVGPRTADQAAAALDLKPRSFRSTKGMND